MNHQPTPHSDFILTFPTDKDGKDVKWRFMVTLSKPMGHNFGSKDNPDMLERRLIKAIGTLDGVDYVNPGVGKYTVEVAIARTFHPEEVIEELERRIKFEVLTEIVTPKFVMP